MRLKPPRVAEILAAAFGLLLLVSLFLPWYGRPVQCIQAPCPPLKENAFEAFAVLDVYLLIVGLAAIGLLVVEMTQRTPAVAVAWAAIGTPLAVVATALVLWRALSPPGAEEAERLFVLLGLAATAGVASAFALSMRNEGLDRHRRVRGAVPRPLPEPIRISPAPGGPSATEEG